MKSLLRGALRYLKPKATLSLVASLTVTSSFAVAQSGLVASKSTEMLNEVAGAAQGTLPFQAPWLSFNTALAALSGSPVALATGDVDSDGDVDVVAAQGYATGGFVLLRNNGAGSF
ncbi:MAG TPA: hypothetical protein VF551_07870, partial [Chthoniobacterales bacterium]